jgi:DNA-binding transcriptional MerR regulator
MAAPMPLEPPVTSAYRPDICSAFVMRLANGYREYGPEAVDVVAFVQDLFAAGLSSRLLREIIPCASGSEAPPPPELLAQVEKVRDDLVHQEQRLRSRRQTLDDYLADRAAPRHPLGVSDAR